MMTPQLVDLAEEICCEFIEDYGSGLAFVYSGKWASPITDHIAAKRSTSTPITPVFMRTTND